MIQIMMTELLFKRRGERVKITEIVIKAVTPGSGGEILTLLFMQPYKRVVVTPQLVCLLAVYAYGLLM